MKFNDLKEKLEVDKNYKPAIKIKDDISVEDKLSFADNVVDLSTYILDNGMIKINFVYKVLNIDISTIRYFTDLELDIELGIIEQYEFLRLKGIIKLIKTKLKNNDNYNELLRVIDSTLEQELNMNNSIESVVADGIYKLIDKIPNQEELGKYVSQIEKLDISKLGVIKDLFNFATKKG